MAKTKAKKDPKPSEPETVDVRFDLLDLPTAQHRAGLAGLLLHIGSMAERKQEGHLKDEVQVPEIVEPKVANGTKTCLAVRFSKQSAQDLFDDLYAAEVVEVRSASRWQGAPQIREDPNPSPKPGEPKRWFVYEVIQPTGPFLRKYMNEGKGAWHKLWRDMIWKVQRGKPTTRIPYNNRSKDEKVPTKEGGDAWKAAVSYGRSAGVRGGQPTVELASAVMLGVQAVNAEMVRFEDRADHNLLLHFWPLTARVFAAEEIDSEGKRKEAGFVLAIPDVSNLVGFCRAYTRFLGELCPRKRGFRPADAVVSLPAQGSLEFMRHLDEIASREALDEGPARFLAGVEFYHMLPAGQNVKMMTHGRIPPEDGLLSAYAGIRESCRNPVFLSRRLLALLRRHPWFAEFGDTLVNRDYSSFVHVSQDRRRTPPDMYSFAWDAQRRFRSIQGDYLSARANYLKKQGRSSHEEVELNDPDERPEVVDQLVYNLVGSYVRERACARSGVDPKDKKWRAKTSAERKDVCSKLFLELRSRNDDDFVRHFTSTLGSVPQWLKNKGYLAVAAALMRPYTEAAGEHRPRTRDDIKTLTLLALSAHSQSYTPRDDAKSANEEENAR